MTGPQSKSIVLETIKQSEDADGIVLRLFESLGGRASGKLSVYVPLLLYKNLAEPRIGWTLADAEWVNILEDSFGTEEGQTSWRKTTDGIEVDLKFRCFEIKTLKLRY